MKEEKEGLDTCKLNPGDIVYWVGRYGANSEIDVIRRYLFLCEDGGFVANVCEFGKDKTSQVNIRELYRSADDAVSVYTDKLRGEFDDRIIKVSSDLKKLKTDIRKTEVPF